VLARLWLSALLLLAACAPEDFTRPGPLAAASETPYLEFCAVSQIRKHRGFGAEIRGEAGGHAVIYLHGACRSRRDPAGQLAPCGSAEAEPGEGAGLSMNAHFRNAAWVATPGRGFLLEADLPPGSAVTRATYAAVQERAKRLGIYDGVAFHEEVFDDMPAGWSRRDWQYEMSVGTDYGIALARGRFCARIPVTEAQRDTMIGFLNDKNRPYREGRAEFHWSLFRDNCIHLAHNALAAAGFWEEWPTHAGWVWSVLNFPVPRNTLVNLLRHATDTALLRDLGANEGFRRFGVLPIRPGVLMDSRPPLTPNEVYETDLRLIFYDQPLFGPYQRWFDALQANPALHDPAANRAWVAAAYRAALAEGPNPPLAAALEALR
jgi:hypothetical protein